MISSSCVERLLSVVVWFGLKDFFQPNTMKNTKPPTPAQLIDALGGPSAVARLITDDKHNEPITPQAVSAWKSQGIPSHRVTQMALAKGRVLRSSADLEPANWPRLFPELQTSLAA